MPDAPAPLEILKIAINGLLVTWHPPLRSNGFVVDMYCIEIVDASIARDDSNYQHIAGIASVNGEESSLSKWHRIIKHKTTDFLQRYITGLEPGRPYVSRVRACNKVVIVL